MLGEMLMDRTDQGSSEQLELDRAAACLCPSWADHDVVIDGCMRIQGSRWETNDGFVQKPATN